MAEADHIETLRRLWTPDTEVAELFADLSPGSELDSMIRHMFCSLIEDLGSVKINLGSEAIPRINNGSIRWEVVHGPGDKPELRPREVTIWHESD